MESNDISTEPMDIDRSTQSVQEMDISYNDSITDTIIFARPSCVSPNPSRLSQHNVSPSEPPIVKKFHINMKTTRNSKTNYTKIISTVIIVLISFIIYNLHCLKCCDELNLIKINETLSSKLYGQSAAVNQMIKTLELEANSKILFFSGGTGVGKTFASSLLLDTIGSCSNIYHYTMPTFQTTFSAHLMIGLTMCKTTLIIVDDLTIEDMDVNLQIKEVIEKSENLGKDLTVILIFSSPYNKGLERYDELFHKKILNKFSNIQALKRFIQFQPLSEKNLKDCIKQELGEKKLSDHEFDYVLKNFNVSLDGCKGVHSKMKYLMTV